MRQVSNQSRKRVIASNPINFYFKSQKSSITEEISSSVIPEIDIPQPAKRVSRQLFVVNRISEKIKSIIPAELDQKKAEDRNSSII